VAVNYKKCPECGSKNSVKIVYGMPSFKLFQEAEAGKVKLGGCCIIEGGPEYHCKDCNNEWNREQVLDIAYGQIRGLKASVGGYFGGYYHVTIDLTNLKTMWLFKEGGSEETSTRSIRNKTAEEFIKCLKEIDLLELFSPDPHGGSIRGAIDSCSIQYCFYDFCSMMLVGLHKVRQLDMQFATTSATEAVESIYFSGPIAFYYSPGSSVVANKGTLAYRTEARFLALNEKYLCLD